MYKHNGFIADPVDTKAQLSSWAFLLVLFLTELHVSSYRICRRNLPLRPVWIRCGIGTLNRFKIFLANLAAKSMVVASSALYGGGSKSHMHERLLTKVGHLAIEAKQLYFFRRETGLFNGNMAACKDVEDINPFTGQGRQVIRIWASFVLFIFYLRIGFYSANGTE